MKDISIPNHRTLSKSTLMGMKKSELIEYIKVLEHDLHVAMLFNERQARNFEDMLKNISQFEVKGGAK